MGAAGLEYPYTGPFSPKALSRSSDLVSRSGHNTPSRQPPRFQEGSPPDSRQGLSTAGPPAACPRP